VGSLIQSIGGGGGSENADIVVDSQANVDLVLALGGAESSGSPGGSVNSTMQGNITTTGNQSQAATVQSIGGGGGNLTVNVRKVAAPETPVSAAATSAPVQYAAVAAPVTAAVDPAGSSTATVMLGADASFNNDGGDMNLNYTGDLSTVGDLSAGQIIQSIGAGGGQLQLTGLDSLDISIGATGNSSGNGGNIEANNEGNIVTAGELSYGIMIQSIGGGGGAAFTDLDESAVNLTLNSDNSGDGGTIDFAQTGDIIVSGDRSIGVFAQSLGGGGGVVDRLFADTAGGAGNSGAITLNLDGSIEALGQDGVGVFAQSRSAADQGNINVTLYTGKRLNFGAGGTGIWFSGGAENSFVNYGTAAGEDGLLGWAVRGEEGDEAVHNYSTFLGQFDLGTGVNSFTNYAEGIFVPGPFLSLGDAANLLTQNGQMMPGDLLHAQHTTLTGSFLQSATGLTFADLDFGSENPNVDGGIIDSIFATGTIDLAGELNVALVNPQLVPYGRFQKTMFQGGKGLTNHGMVLTTAPSVVISYDLVYPGLDAAALDYNVDFSPAGLGRNLQQVGDYFNRIQSAGSSPELADTVIRLLYEPDMGMYSELLSQMSPEFYGELQAEQLRRSQRFIEILADGGAYRFTKKNRVVWFHFEKETNEQDATADLKGAKHYTDRYAVGFQNKFNDRWTGGIGLSVEDNESESKQKQWTSDGDALYLGASLKREFNNTNLTGSISYGWAESNMERRGQITEPFLAETDRDYNILGGLLRASHTFYHGQVYFRPIFDLGLTDLKADKASEKGADGVSLEIEDYNKTYTWMRPAIALGYSHPFNNGWEMRMRADVGFHYYFSGAETNVRAGFAGAPLGVEPMDVLVDFDRSYTLAALGIDLLTTQDISLGLRYSKIIGDRSDLDRWGVVLKIPF
ncbi:MAG: autotransporter outer membrane beta-barrel domain-containing protein, partial [Desulfobulbales bacterium]